MKKFYRILYPIFMNIIFGAALFYIITQYYHGIDSKSLFIKISSLTGISIFTLLLIVSIRGFFDIVFYVPLYGIMSTVFLSYVSYTEITSAKPTLIETMIPVTLLLILASILPEAKRRSSIKKLANSCIKGEKLEQYSKAPWRLFDEKPHEYMCTLYFDIPGMYHCQSVLSSKELKTFIEDIFLKNFKTIEKYFGTLVRSTEDSMLIAFEPIEQKNIKASMEPKVHCAYNATVCALELRQNLEEIKARLNNESPLIKALKGRCGIASDKGLMLKHIRNGRMELSIFTNSMNTIADMLRKSNENEVLSDAITYELCSEYFSAKKINNDHYSIVGISN